MAGPAYPPAAPPPPVAQGPSGAVGKPRSIGVSILLAIVTLGIYTYVWTWKTHGEIKNTQASGWAVRSDSSSARSCGS